MPVSKSRKNAKVNRPVPPAYVKDNPLLDQGKTKRQPNWEDCTDLYSELKNIADVSIPKADEIISFKEESGEVGLEEVKKLATDIKQESEALLTEARQHISKAPKRRGIVGPNAYSEYMTIQADLITVHNRAHSIFDKWNKIKDILQPETANSTDADIAAQEARLDGAPYSEKALEN